MNWLEQLLQRSKRLLHQQAARPGQQPRHRVAVVTDSAASLPADWVNQPDTADWLRVVPMPVMISGQIYGEGVDDVASALAVGLAEGRDIKTSRPSPGLLERTYRELEELGFEAIVSIHLSAELSGTIEAAGLAADGVGIPVEVVDTRSAALGQGFAVIDAVIAAQSGFDRQTVAERAKAAAVCSGRLLLCAQPGPVAPRRPDFRCLRRAGVVAVHQAAARHPRRRDHPAGEGAHRRARPGPVAATGGAPDRGTRLRTTGLGALLR